MDKVCWQLGESPRFCLLSQTSPFHNRRWNISETAIWAIDCPADIARSPEAIFLETATLNGGRSAGVQLVRIRTPRSFVEIVLSRGGGISKLALDGLSLGWQSPIAGPIHPQNVPLYRPDGLGWLAGFDEVLARCGLFNVGPPQFDERQHLTHPLHGDIAHQICDQAWLEIDPQGRQLVIETRVALDLFHFHHLSLTSRLALSWDHPQLQVADTIENRGSRPAEIMLLHHWNFGPPLAAAGSQLTIPARAVSPRNDHAASLIDNWDRLDAPQAGSQESVYFLQTLADPQDQAQALLRSADGRHGLMLQWPSQALPYLTIWKNPVAQQDGYAVGIEPGTCYPNGRAHEAAAGRLVNLAGGQSHRCHVQLTGMIDQPDQVAEAAQTFQQKQAAAQQTRHPRPNPDFGPLD